MVDLIPSLLFISLEIHFYFLLELTLLVALGGMYLSILLLVFSSFWAFFYFCVSYGSFFMTNGAA
jgi:hypothetical protein